MISIQPPHTQAVHLVAPPSTHYHPAASSYGRTIPCLLLAAALRNHLTPPPPLSRIFIIGDDSTKATAAALDLPYTDHLTPILSSPITLRRPLFYRLAGASPSRIICWSDELLPLASVVAARFDIPVELISTNPRAITKPPQNIDTIRVFESTDHDTWFDLRQTCQTDHLLAPLIDLAPPTPEQRAAARAHFEIDDHTIVLGAIADAPSQVDSREFAFLLGLLSVSGYQVLGIVPKAATNLNQALRHHRGLNKPFRILTTTDPLPTLFPLLDACIHPADERSGSTNLIDRLCERADIPILHLRHSGKAGFSRAQGTSARLLDQMDDIASQLHARTAAAPQATPQTAQ